MSYCAAYVQKFLRMGFFYQLSFHAATPTTSILLQIRLQITTNYPLLHIQRAKLPARSYSNLFSSVCILFRQMLVVKNLSHHLNEIYLIFYCQISLSDLSFQYLYYGILNCSSYIFACSFTGLVIRFDRIPSSCCLASFLFWTCSKWMVMAIATSKPYFAV